MSEYKIVVQTDHAGKVNHYYATESDARFQFSEWRGQGVDCELVMPLPTKVFLAWETDVTEKYRATVNVVDLPQSVQDALAGGASLIDIDRANEEDLQAAYDDLWAYIADHEEGPYDENVGARDLDYTTMEKGPDDGR